QLSPRIAHMVGKVAAVEFSITASETEALLLENNLIKQLKPRYNILFRDDKTYPYLRITDDRFARIAYYRGATQAKGHFFGPFPSAWAVKESLQILQKVFHLRTCEDSVFANRTRPCLEHQIGRCSGPCVGLIDEAEYREDIDRALRFLRGETTHILNELESLMLAHSEAMAFEKAAVYRNRMAALSKVLQQQSMESEGEHDIDVIAHAQHGGHASLVVASIRGGRHLGDRSFIVELPGQSEAEPLHEETQAELLERFVLGFYETARLPAVLLADFTPNESLRSWCDAKAGQSLQWLHQAQGVRRQWLQQAQHNAQAHLKQHLAQRSSARDRTQALIGLLAPHSEVKAEDFRIECFDISHSSGEATQASCVVYKQHALQQKLYRRYNIENITAGDDYAAMAQVLERRYAANPQALPELVLIDGGKGQVSVAAKLPNWLTWARVVAIPMLVGLFFLPIPSELRDALATALFVLAAATDWLDGWLARKLSVTTAFGAFLDPVADKLIVAAALVMLLTLGRVEAWIAFVIIGREITISALREWMAELGQRKSVAVHWVGKLKTVAQLVSIPML
ncbi:MAG: excinuclease ABC subunit UvrC, partial [Betaproteobacteria bacterium]|nr:excinuclease ABC subunit UvrC [Betaproteobacteria bacterium]